MGSNIRTIGSYAFSGNISLKEVNIPNNISQIGSYAFSGDTKLNNVIIGKEVTSLPERVFNDCFSLRSLVIPANINEIGNYAFAGCRSLSDITIEENGAIKGGSLVLGSNGSNPLFNDCPLDEVFIGRKLSYHTGSNYGYSPFYRNTNLRTVKIADVETQVYDNEFYGCTSLKNVYIGDGVTSIGKYAFSGCASLESFKCGSSLQSIGVEAFSDCTAMTNLYSRALTPPTCGSQALEDINKWECTLHVLPEAAGAYKSADQWKDFFFVDGEWSSIDSVVADYDGDMSINDKTVQFPEPRNVAVYSTDGRVAYRGETNAISLEPGLYLIVVDGKQRHKIVIR